MPAGTPVARHARAAGPGDGRRAGPWFFVALVAVSLLLAVALYWPVGPFDGSHLPAGATEDPAQTVWFLAWVPFALAHGHNIFETSYLDVPGRVNLADNTLMPLLGLLGAPVTVLFGPIVTYNVLLRVSFALSTLAMGIALRPLCRRRSAVAAGALLYGFSPYLMSEGFGDAHLQLLFVPVPPLVMWCATRVLRTRIRPVPTGCLAGLLLAAQAYVAPDVVGSLGILALAGVVVVAAAPGLRRRTDWRRLAYAALGAGAVFVVVAGPLFGWAVAGPGHLTGAVQQPANLQAYHGDLLGPVVPTSRQLLAPSALTSMSSGFAGRDPSEHLAYLGLPLVALLCVIAVRFRRDRVVAAGVVLGVVAFVLSLGPELTVANHTTGLALPEAVLQHLPLLDSTVPSRFALEVVLFAGVVLARGIDGWLVAWAGDRSVWRPAALGAALCLCVVALLPSFAAPETPTGPTGVSSALGRLPLGSVVLAYPYPKTPYNAAMVWAAEDAVGFRLVGGYATIRGPDGNGVMTGPLLSPPEVQEYLVTLENGGVPLFYPPPAGGSATADELCRFLARYGVDDVVMARRGVDGLDKARALVTSVLGAPTRTTRSFESWRVSHAALSC